LPETNGESEPLPQSTQKFQNYSDLAISLLPFYFGSVVGRQIRGCGGRTVGIKHLVALILLCSCGGMKLLAQDGAVDLKPDESAVVTPSATSLLLLPTRPHVVLIIEENRSFSSVYPYGMPWLSALGNAHGIATDYHSDESGSLLDYLYLSSGSSESSFGCNGGLCSRPITSNNIFRQLNRAGLSWKVYAESLPYAGFMGLYSGAYVKRHNPAAWYSDVVYSWRQRKKMVPFTQFAKDLADNVLPQYSVIIPNERHDAHSGTMAAADFWLKENITPLLNSHYFKTDGTGVLIITFDNGNFDRAGRVFTAVVGPSMVDRMRINLWFRHENTLRTMMELLGLTDYPGAAAEVQPMVEFLKSHY
jgi:phosphatidylinositol-3-phosphatase